jgi:hypothetical protein
VNMAEFADFMGDDSAHEFLEIDFS